jgi:hypothetical protein
LTPAAPHPKIGNLEIVFFLGDAVMSFAWSKACQLRIMLVFFGTLWMDSALITLAADK